MNVTKMQQKLVEEFFYMMKLLEFDLLSMLLKYWFSNIYILVGIS